MLFVTSREMELVLAFRCNSQCSKQGGRLGVTKQQGISGLETASSNLSKKQVSAWSSPNRSACITSMLSARKLYFLETRNSKGVDAKQQNWSVQLGNILYTFSPFSLIPR